MIDYTDDESALPSVDLNLLQSKVVSMSDRQENYTFQGNTGFASYMTSTRSADRQAAFFLPHLQSGMKLLDCGSGPGSITVGLAKAVAPGQTVGIDNDLFQVERAQIYASEQGVDNVKFESGSVYQLPFSDDSFDAVFSHALFEHLNDPLSALKEMQRVVKPDGVVGVRTRDWGGTLLAPDDPILWQSIELWERLSALNGGTPRVARHLRGLLHGAGFSRANISASYDSHATPESIHQWSHFWASELMGNMGKRFIEQGWVDQESIEQMSQAWQAWRERPDAFLARAFCEAVAWR
jgi:SAM-dependent methyltransferase